MPYTTTKFFGSVRISVGATSSTPGRLSILSARLSGMTALENAKNMDELGGCTMMSAPTPSTRLPHSETTPDVSPTIIRIKITWMAMATMVRPARNGRATMLPQSNWSSETGPSRESSMERCAALTVTPEKRGGQNGQNGARQAECRKVRGMFRFCKDFNTCVDKLVEKGTARELTERKFNHLMRIAQLLCSETCRAA